MQIIDATAAVLMVLAVFIGAMAWQIRDSLEKLIAAQNEILAELIYARYRTGDSRGLSGEIPETKKSQSLMSEAKIVATHISVRGAKA